MCDDNPERLVDSFQWRSYLFDGIPWKVNSESAYDEANDLSIYSYYDVEKWELLISLKKNVDGRSVLSIHVKQLIKRRI